MTEGKGGPDLVTRKENARKLKIAKMSAKNTLDGSPEKRAIAIAGFLEDVLKISTIRVGIGVDMRNDFGDDETAIAFMDSFKV